MTLKIEYSIEVEHEDEPVRGNFASGDDAADKALEDEIIARDEQGDTWAWCMVKVVAECEGFKGYDTLGGCSYIDEEDFKTGGYYEQMCDEAREDLLRVMAEVEEQGQLASRLLFEHYEETPTPEEKCADCGIEYSKTVSHQADCPRLKEE